MRRKISRLNKILAVFVCFIAFCSALDYIISNPYNAWIAVYSGFSVTAIYYVYGMLKERKGNK